MKKIFSWVALGLSFLISDSLSASAADEESRECLRIKRDILQHYAPQTLERYAFNPLVVAGYIVLNEHFCTISVEDGVSEEEALQLFKRNLPNPSAVLTGAFYPTMTLKGPAQFHLNSKGEISGVRATYSYKGRPSRFALSIQGYDLSVVFQLDDEDASILNGQPSLLLMPKMLNDLTNIHARLAQAEQLKSEIEELKKQFQILQTSISSKLSEDVEVSLPPSSPIVSTETLPEATAAAPPLPPPLPILFDTSRKDWRITFNIESELGQESDKIYYKNLSKEFQDRIKIMPMKSRNFFFSLPEGFREKFFALNLSVEQEKVLTQLDRPKQNEILSSSHAELSGRFERVVKEYQAKLVLEASKSNMLNAIKKALDARRNALESLDDQKVEKDEKNPTSSKDDKEWQ